MRLGAFGLRTLFIAFSLLLTAVRIDAFELSDGEFQGTLHATGPEWNTTTGTLEFEVNVEGSTLTLRSGEFEEIVNLEPQIQFLVSHLAKLLVTDNGTLGVNDPSSPLLDAETIDEVTARLLEREFVGAASDLEAILGEADTRFSIFWTSDDELVWAVINVGDEPHFEAAGTFQSTESEIATNKVSSSAGGTRWIDLAIEIAVKRAFSDSTDPAKAWFDFVATSIVKPDPKSAVRCVQAALNNRNYAVGQEDGIIGSRTKAAIRSYLNAGDFNLSLPPLTEESAVDYCLLFLQTESVELQSNVTLTSENGASILVTNADAYEMAEELEEQSWLGVMESLAKIAAADIGYVETSRDSRAVVYVIWDQIEDDEIIQTEWSFRRETTRSWYSERYAFRVSKETPSNPLIIFNEYFASVGGEFRFRVIRESETLMERYLPVR